MTSSEHLQGSWCPEQLQAAEDAYAEVIRRLDVSQQSERDAIARVLLKMTSDWTLDTKVLVQQCIAWLYPLTLTQAKSTSIQEIATVAMQEAVRFAIR